MCEPVTVGGVLVRPGDVMRADADGVVVVRREDAAEVAAASQERIDTEADYIAAYRGGRTVIDICNLEPLLAAKGLVIEE
jgi:4-hydroxy-4-methyl-2-oxoglutarate aldolase